MDDILLQQWTFAGELLNLLWVIEATLDLHLEGAAFLEEVCGSDLFSQNELPIPSDEEGKPPKKAPAIGEQIELLAEC